MESQESLNCAVLLVGFNRPEFIHQRLLEIGNEFSLDVIVSIDGGISSTDKNLYTQIELSLDRKYFRFIYHDSNLGLVSHITGVISKTLEDYQNVIVIEDDVRISRNFILALAENLAHSSDPRIATWGGFSPIRPRNFVEPFNCWRKTIYFSAWGWGISRIAWQKYTSILPSDDFENEFKESEIWNKLSGFQKRVWKSRFKKVFDNPSYIWDYQMQYMSFKYDLLHVLPVFRLSDNEGFDDSRSTNTKSRRPHWMGRVAIAKLEPSPKFLSKHTAGYLTSIDSLTFSGDSKLLNLIPQMRTLTLNPRNRPHSIYRGRKH